MFSQQLRIPGPTPIPQSVQQAMNQAMVGHRDHETKDLIHTIQPLLRPIFGTEQDVIVLASSGTGGLETAAVNIAKAGDEVLVAVTGAFGDRFASICEAHDLKTHRMNVTWGKAADPEELKTFLQKNPAIQAVFLTFCETSTGVINPIKELAEVVHEFSNAYVVVDGVSSVGGTASHMDDWGIDILVTGSQKALMLPPGLAFVAVSERAWKQIEKNPQRRFYFDLRKYKESLAEDSTPFTPPVSLLYGLKQAVTLIDQEGLSNIYKRHELMMNMTRKACKSLGLPLLASDNIASPTITAIKPAHFSAKKLKTLLKTKFNLNVAGGQSHLADEIIRIGHMGYCSPNDILLCISLLEMGLSELTGEDMFSVGTREAEKEYTHFWNQ